jgi:hypothetical protein
MVQASWSKAVESVPTDAALLERAAGAVAWASYRAELRDHLVRAAVQV